MTAFTHSSVLLEESLRWWITDAAEGAWYADGTLGGGGHSLALLERTRARLIGIDRDADALNAARERLAPYAERTVFVHANHRELPEALERNGIPSVRGILLDLGVSSYQLDAPERGFSYQHDAPLDMRMDAAQKLSADEVVNGYAEERLARILYEYGEERFSRRIARAIVRERPVRTTGQLDEIIKQAMPGVSRATGGHPSRRTFQALRIEVNDELGGLSESLDRCFRCLCPGGRLCVITFHSLEDRIVKQRMRLWENPCTCPPKAPKCVCGKVPQAVLRERGGIVPGEEEIAGNPRARSARLRIAEAL